MTRRRFRRWCRACRVRPLFRHQRKACGTACRMVLLNARPAARPTPTRTLGIAGRAPKGDRRSAA